MALQYKRNDQNFYRGTFRARGEYLEIFPSHLEDRAWRLSLFGNKLENIEEFDPGLDGDSDTWKKKGIWPELRRTESRRFAYKLKEAFEKIRPLNFENIEILKNV